MRDFRRCNALYEKNSDFFESNKMLGPNALWLIEILSEKLDLKPGMRVLDMGCGMGLTSIFLAKEFGVTVFAADLWIDPTENYRRFVEMGVEDKIIPLRTEARSMPFPEGYFDLAVSIDAYHYFGTDEMYFPGHYSKLVKKGGQFGIVSPGLSREFVNGLPEPLSKYWEPELYSFHSAKWWQNMWQKTGLVDVTFSDQIIDGKEIWRSTADFDLHEADKEDYLTLIMMTAIKK